MALPWIKWQPADQISHSLQMIHSVLVFTSVYEIIIAVFETYRLTTSMLYWVNGDILYSHESLCPNLDVASCFLQPLKLRGLVLLTSMSVHLSSAKGFFFKLGEGEKESCFINHSMISEIDFIFTDIPFSFLIQAFQWVQYISADTQGLNNSFYIAYEPEKQHLFYHLTLNRSAVEMSQNVQWFNLPSFLSLHSSILGRQFGLLLPEYSSNYPPLSVF